MSSFYEFLRAEEWRGRGLGRNGLAYLPMTSNQEKERATSLIGVPNISTVEDVAKLTSKHLPGRADLAWASFLARTCL